MFGTDPATDHAVVSRRAVLLGAGAAAAATALGAGLAAPSQAAPRRAATARTLIVNGRVYAGRRAPAAEAVAVGRDGRILAVGSTRQVKRFAGRGTQVVDAHGGTIMAGIRDGHMHPLYAADAMLNPTLENASGTVPELQQALQAMLDASAAKEPDGWLRVVDWNPVGLLPTGTVANKSYLDALNTSRPICLQGSDGHNSWVNSRALAIAGITKSTPNPAGGEIVKGADGEPTGLLKDTAQGLVSRLIPPPSTSEIEASQRRVFAMMLAQGITSFQDAVCDESSLKAYLRLLSTGGMRQRVVPALLVDSDLTGHPTQARQYLGDLRKRYGSHPRLHIGTAKVFMDGVIEFPSQTAALLEPYLDKDGRPTDNRGDLYVSNKDFQNLAVALDRAGWQLHCHSIGDRAARVALNGFAAARRHNGGHDRRHTIAHLQLVHPDDYRRFARLGVIASMSLQWAVRDIWTVDALRPYIGNKRFRRMYPAGSLERNGAWLAGGSDWPVDPLSTFNQIATAVDRSGPWADYERPLNLRQALTRDEALRMHTSHGALQLGERRAGTVAPGQQGDLIVLDRDVTRGSTNRLRKATVAYTLIDGKVVHHADSAAGRSSASFAAAGATLSRLAPASRKSSCCGAGAH